MESLTHYSLKELCSLVNLPVRTVRYYIQSNLVDKPNGANRGAYYTVKQLNQLLTIIKWQSAGLSLERIREIIGGDSEALPPPRARHVGDIVVRSHIALARGVEICIDPEDAGLSSESVRKLIKLFVADLEKINVDNQINGKKADRKMVFEQETAQSVALESEEVSELDEEA